MRVYSIKNRNFIQRDAFFIIYYSKLNKIIIYDWMADKNLIIMGYFKKFWFLLEKSKQFLINQVKLFLIFFNKIIADPDLR